MSLPQKIQESLRVALAAGITLFCHAMLFGGTLSIPLKSGIKEYAIAALLFITALLAGWVAGCIAPRRAVMGIIPLYIAVALFGWLQFPTTNLHRLALFTMPVVCLGALIHVWLRARRSPRNIASS